MIGLFLEGLMQLMGSSGNIAEVTADGRLKVDMTPVAPPDTTSVLESVNSVLANTTPVDTYYVIPTGEQLIIQTLEGNTSTSAQGSTISLWYQPNGSAAGEIQITLNIQVNGSNYIKSINWTCPALGNGTRRIALRRQRNDSTSRSVGAEWKGYY